MLITIYCGVCVFPPLNISNIIQPIKCMLACYEHVSIFFGNIFSYYKSLLFLLKFILYKENQNCIRNWMKLFHLCKWLWFMLSPFNWIAISTIRERFWIGILLFFFLSMVMRYIFFWINLSWDKKTESHEGSKIKYQFRKVNKHLIM